MAEKRIYIGSHGPFFYTDTDSYPTPQDAADQGFGDGVTMEAAHSDGTATFSGMSLGDGELTCGSINRASGTLTIEVGGVAQISITSTGATFGGDIVVSEDGTVGTVGLYFTFDDSGNVVTLTGGGLTIAGDLSLAGYSITGTSVDINNAELQQLSNIGAATISSTQWGYLGSSTAAGGAVLDAANDAAILALLSGDDSAAFSWNSQNLTSVGTIGCGAITTTGLFTGTQAIFQDTTVDTTATYAGLTAEWTKTAGATDDSDLFYGIKSYMKMNDADSTIGFLYGLQAQAILTAGNVGDGQEDMLGALCQAKMEGGTASRTVYGAQMFANIDAGTITGGIYGLYCNVDIESGVTSIGGSVYGLAVVVDCDKNPDGSCFAIYWAEADGVDYGLYQSGTAANYLGGALTVTGTLNVTGLAGADPAGHKAVYYNTTTKSLFYDNT